MAKQLVTILKDQYPKAPIDEADSLTRAYSGNLGEFPENVWSTLKKIFGGAHHEEWFQRSPPSCSECDAQR